jgi:hypothetical protein
MTRLGLRAIASVAAIAGAPRAVVCPLCFIEVATLGAESRAKCLGRHLASECARSGRLAKAP